MSTGAFSGVFFFLFGQKGELYTPGLFYFFLMPRILLTSTTRPGFFGMYCGLRGG